MKKIKLKKFCIVNGIRNYTCQGNESALASLFQCSNIILLVLAVTRVCLGCIRLLVKYWTTPTNSESCEKLESVWTSVLLELFWQWYIQYCLRVFMCIIGYFLNNCNETLRLIKTTRNYTTHTHICRQKLFHELFTSELQ